MNGQIIFRIRVRVLQIQHSSSSNDLVSQQQEVKMSGRALRLEYYFVYEGRVGGEGGGIW